MSVYKRGRTYWYKFLFQGQLIRDSAKSNSKTVAREAERARRRELEMAVNRIPKRDRTPLFRIAAQDSHPSIIDKHQPFSACSS
jgi:hypothetical protein